MSFPGLDAAIKETCTRCYKEVDNIFETDIEKFLDNLEIEVRKAAREWLDTNYPGFEATDEMVESAGTWKREENRRKIEDARTWPII